MKLIALLAFSFALQANASSLHIDGDAATALMDAVAIAGSPVTCKVEPCGNKIAALACSENDPHGLSCLANAQNADGKMDAQAWLKPFGARQLLNTLEASSKGAVVPHFDAAGNSYLSLVAVSCIVAPGETDPVNAVQCTIEN